MCVCVRACVYVCVLGVVCDNVLVVVGEILNAFRRFLNVQKFCNVSVMCSGKLSSVLKNVFSL